MKIYAEISTVADYARGTQPATLNAELVSGKLPEQV